MVLLGLPRMLLSGLSMRISAATQYVQEASIDRGDIGGL